MVAAWRLARDDPMRACTHNKGVMNGVTAAALATGQDTRAVEAALHTYAGTTGRYQPLTELRVRDGFLEATFEGPIAVGTRGGSVRAHPLFAYSLAQLGWPSAKELAMLLGCIGLAQNLAAVRALAIEGIQKGHMRLHNRK
jgi:hydroxymethylglutaryl-CoA reductase